MGKREKRSNADSVPYNPIAPALPRQLQPRRTAFQKDGMEEVVMQRREERALEEAQATLNELKSQKEEVKRLKEEGDELASALSQETKAVARLEKEIATKNTQIDAIQAKLDKQQSGTSIPNPSAAGPQPQTPSEDSIALEAAQKRVAELKEEIAGQLKTLKEHEQTISDLEKQSSYLEKEAAAARAPGGDPNDIKAQDWRDVVANAEDQLDALTLEKKKAEEETKKAEAELAEVQKEAEAAQAEMEKVKKARDTLQAELAAAEIAAAEPTSSSPGVSAETAQKFSATIQKLNHENAALRDENTKMMMKLSGIDV